MCGDKGLGKSWFLNSTSTFCCSENAGDQDARMAPNQAYRQNDSYRA
jgi:hypothetical protein